jgi:hypothetical protein
MTEKKNRGEFTLEHDELSSIEMVFIALTMLESRGYPGFMELMSVINDPSLILKIIRLFYGMTIQIPPLKEFITCLQASQYAFCDIHKKVNNSLPAKPKDIRQFMNIDEEREAELLKIFDEWCIYMNKQGHDIRNYFHFNRNNTKKRIDMVTKGKKWKAKKY